MSAAAGDPHHLTGEKVMTEDTAIGGGGG
jgi:hypothetical protein